MQATTSNLHHLGPIHQPVVAPEPYRAAEHAFTNGIAAPCEIPLPPLKFVVSGSPTIHLIPNCEIRTYQVRTNPVVGPESYRAAEQAFPNRIAEPREVTLPPLKFVVSGSPTIHLIPDREIRTYQVRTNPGGDLKHVAAEQLEIDLEAVQDIHGDRIEEAGWPLIAFSWPYYLWKFTLIGAPLVAQSLLTIEFKHKPLAIKLAVPRPHHLTVDMLRTIVVEYLRQLETTGQLATLGFSPCDVDSVHIEGATSSDLVEALLNRTSQGCRETPTLFARTGDPSAGTGDPSADADNENPSDSAARTYIAVQTRWVNFPDKREQTQDILMPAVTPMSEVKSSIERSFFQFMCVDHERWKNKLIARHDVVMRCDDGHWTEVPHDNPTLGSLQRPMRSVLHYRHYPQID
ncbi:hypothetical protein FN846DRAFT_910400 [Sphaerosporella brunnea]|uniref:Uncharacterized protein n=1 Tax=Sphaerosporella brunnea TaxID=1250544 RepID=A0A5J5EMC6_9PEZI|nr:hypothetical protein FN846DRAFT_910400 [Sphaerosporella brunnea]